ncbi:hypothetical protein [Bacteroides sp. MSB163]
MGNICPIISPIRCINSDFTKIGVKDWATESRTTIMLLMTWVGIVI